MAEFGSIEETPLLHKIRDGEATGIDEVDVIAARNFAHFLKPHIDILIGQLQRQTGKEVDLSIEAERGRLAEVVMTGLQLAIEHQTDSLAGYVHQPEPVAGR